MRWDFHSPRPVRLRVSASADLYTPLIFSLTLSWSSPPPVGSLSTKLAETVHYILKFSTLNSQFSIPQPVSLPTILGVSHH